MVVDVHTVVCFIYTLADSEEQVCCQNRSNLYE